MKHLTRIGLPLMPVVLFAVVASDRATALFYRFVLNTYLVLIIAVAIAVTIGILALGNRCKNPSGYS